MLSESVSKETLSKLSSEVLRMIGIGQYSLYKISSEKNPIAFYALRTGVTEIFLLREDGEPIVKESSIDFVIERKITIDNISVRTSIPNLCARA
jgi:hypothetical protein